MISLYQDQTGNCTLIAENNGKYIGLVTPGTGKFSEDVRLLAMRKEPLGYEYLDEFASLLFLNHRSGEKIAELHGDEISYFPDGDVPAYIS